MSEYADINIKKLSLFWFRNYVDSYIVSLLFSVKNLIITPNCKVDPEEDDSDLYTRYVYKTTVKDAKERLEAQGFSMANFQKVFNENILQAIDYSAFLCHLGVDFDEHDEEIQRRTRKKVTFRKWKNAMHKIVSYQLENGNINEYNSILPACITTECDKIIFYSLASSYSDSFYGLDTEFIHIAYIVRLILDCCDSNDKIVLDFSNLGYWDKDCIPKAISATEDVEKTIVLVEGTSDKDILEFAMQRLYPHLSDLFYFMDFEEANGIKRAGGTSFIIANIKTFYFSRLKSKFIAIFDNDAEGYQSQMTLLNEINPWPDNFKILTYPDLPLYRKYPTLAPNGTIMFDNINKKACSIELYLPDSIIKENGEYLPIEWESRKKIKITDKIEKAIYQGVISQKREIKKNFYALCKAIEKGENVFFPDEWERMKRLLETIIFAFVKE